MPTFNSARVAVPKFLTVYIGEQVWVPAARASGKAVRATVIRLDDNHDVTATVALEDGSRRSTRRLLPVGMFTKEQAEAIFDRFHGPNLAYDKPATPGGHPLVVMDEAAALEVAGEPIPVPPATPRCPPAPPIVPTPGTTPGWWAEDVPETPTPKRRRSV